MPKIIQAQLLEMQNVNGTHATGSNNSNPYTLKSERYNNSFTRRKYNAKR
jgi:hypothetical protein